MRSVSTPLTPGGRSVDGDAKAVTDRWRTQVKKGVLEFIILLRLRGADQYGYELITEIKRAMQLDVSEGTVYPLLARLGKDGLVTAYWQEGDGVPRKYYRLTDQGRKVLRTMQDSWLELTFAVQRLIARG